METLFLNLKSSLRIMLTNSQKFHISYHDLNGQLIYNIMESRRWIVFKSFFFYLFKNWQLWDCFFSNFGCFLRKCNSSRIFFKKVVTFAWVTGISTLQRSRYFKIYYFYIKSRYFIFLEAYAIRIRVKDITLLLPSISILTRRLMSKVPQKQ